MDDLVIAEGEDLVMAEDIMKDDIGSQGWSRQGQRRRTAQGRTAQEDSAGWQVMSNRVSNRVAVQLLLRNRLLGECPISKDVIIHRQRANARQWCFRWRSGGSDDHSDHSVKMMIASEIMIRSRRWAKKWPVTHSGS